jgi:dipeptidyl-peptidase-4
MNASRPRPRSIVAGAFVLHFALVAAGSAQAQGSAEDYRRARELGRRFDAGLVLGVPEDLHWSADGVLEYRVERAPGQTTWVAVDPRELLEPRTEFSMDDVPWRASGLPESSRIASARRVGALTFELLLEGGGLWSWTLEAGRLTPLDPGSATRWHWPFAAERGDGGGPTHFWCVNATEERLRLQWLDGSGEAVTYAELQPEQAHWQHTYAGHAWRVVDGEGAELRSFEGEPRPGVVWVDGSTGGEAGGASPKKRKFRPGAVREPVVGGRAFIRDHDLWWRDEAAGEEWPLTTDGTEEHGYLEPRTWSSDRSCALFVRERRPQQRKIWLTDALPTREAQPELRELDYTKPGDPIRTQSVYLLKVSPEVGPEVLRVDDRLMPNPWRLSRMAYDAGRERFTLLYNERGHGVVRWLAIDAGTAEVSVLIDEDPETFVDYTNKLHLDVDPARGEALWLSERSGWNHLYAVDLDDGAVRPVTSGEWLIRRVRSVDEGWAHLEVLGYHADQDPYHVHHLRVPLDGGEPVVLTRGDGTHELEFSPDGEFYIDRYSRVDLAPVTELRRTRDGELVARLEAGDCTALEELGWRPPERFVAAGRDGVTPIWGIVHRPTNFDPSRSYPVIEQIYAGPHGQHVPKSFRTVHGAQAMAELGFVVVQIDGMGTNWRSKAFHDVCWKNLGDAGLPDRIAWIRALAREDASLDLERVGIYGGSAGGQNALGALLMHPDFYKAGVADCGCHDNRMDKIWWNEMWMGYPVGPHYAEQSNVTRAHRLQGELLLIVGALDSNVDPQSTMQVVEALIEADKDFELLVMPSAGHGAAETSYGSRRRQDFFVRELLGREPRWEP